MDISWGCGWFLATLFVVLNLIGQLGGVAMVLLRIKVDIACGLLFGIVFLQVRQIFIYVQEIYQALLWYVLFHTKINSMEKLLFLFLSNFLIFASIPLYVFDHYSK